MAVRAIRGAVQVDANESAAILEGTSELVTEVMARNQLTPADVISVVFSATTDLNAEFPALAARKLGFQDVPLLCCSRDRGPERDAAGRPADDARGDRGAAIGDAACLPARRGRAAAGHRAVTGSAAGAAPAAAKVVVIGTGMIGTSVALALRDRGAEVWLADADPAAARLAADIGAGAEMPDGGPPRRPGRPRRARHAARGGRAGSGGGAGARSRPLVHRRRKRQGAAAGPRPRAWLRSDVVRRRPSAVRA